MKHTFIGFFSGYTAHPNCSVGDKCNSRAPYGWTNLSICTSPLSAFGCWSLRYCNNNYYKVCIQKQVNCSTFKRTSKSLTTVKHVFQWPTSFFSWYIIPMYSISLWVTVCINEIIIHSLQWQVLYCTIAFTDDPINIYTNCMWGINTHTHSNN